MNAPMPSVSVMTWNVQRASATRAVRQAQWLASCAQADLIALTEVAGGAAGERLADALRAHGYQCQLPAGDGRDYRVLLGARVGCLTPVADVRAAHLPHRLAAGTVDLPGGRRVSLIGLYVPSRGTRDHRNVAKRAFQAAVAAVLPTLGPTFGPGMPVLVAGDLNVVEPGHQPPLAVFGAWEYDFYRVFATAGFTDAFRHRQPDAVDHSWYGRHGTGYRIDHLFCASAHIDAVTRCRYLHHPRTSQLSDHAALAADLTLT